MKAGVLPLAFLGVLAGSVLAAQTKVSGTATCKPDPVTAVPRSDNPNRSVAVGRAECTWTGFTLAGVATKSGVSTDFDEMTADGVSFHGYHVAAMANGDSTVAKYEGKAKMKDGKPIGSEGTWAYEGGTGKLKGIQGKGSFKATPNADGTVTYQVDGEYKLP
jgi:hypothetical protein